MSINLSPKRCGLFGLLDMRGETHCYSSKFHFRATNRVSYESWHIFLKFDTLLRLLRLNLRPLEVAEVAKVQTWKKCFKFSKIFNFWATKMLYTSKESWEQSSLIFETKLQTFVWKKMKKSQFRVFRSQKIVIFWRSRLNFWKTCQDSKKMTLPTSSWDAYGQSQEFLWT